MREEIRIWLLNLLFGIINGMKERTKIVLSISVLALVVLFIALFFSNFEPEPEPVISEVGYFNEEGTDDILVFYDREEETALLYSSRMAGVVLSQVPSASGVRYENIDLDLVLWNKGDEVTLYRGDEIIFAGWTRQALEERVGANLSPTERLKSQNWVWQETIMSNDDVIVPNRPGEFVVNFTDNNRVAISTDCNQISGTYRLSDGGIEFTNLAMTKMFCEDSQEEEFKNMILRSNRYLFDQLGNLTLLLAFDSGSVIFSRQ